MNIDYAKRDLQKASFKNENLANINFMGSDLRGADFSGADLTGANFSNVRTGIRPVIKFWIFVIALVVSLLSGYVAMLGGTTIQKMLKSPDLGLRAAGVASIIVIVAFIALYYWKGGRTVIRKLLVPALIVFIAIGVLTYVSKLGTGRGMLFLVISLLLVVIMVTIGTVGRAIAGVLSSTLLFILVAVGGSMLGTSVGGGIGTVLMAISCALISKRALSSAKGFESLKRITSFITSKYGTSFRNANLRNTNFSGTTIRNADFTNADITLVNWGDSKQINCTPVPEGDSKF